MPRQFETFLAMRYLRSKRKEVFVSIITVLSVLGVAVSVIVLNMTMSIMSGLEEALQEKLIDASAHVVVKKYGGDTENSDEIVKKVEAVPHVLSAFPFTMNQALISNESGARGILIRGVADLPEPKQKLGKMLAKPEDVEVLFHAPKIHVERPDGDTNEVRLPPLIVGKALQEKLNLLPGTPVSVLSPEMGSSPQGLIPRMKRFLVIDAYESGMLEFETGLAYTTLKDAQVFFNLGESVSGIEVTVDEPMKAIAIAQQIAKALSDLDSLYTATDWTQPNKPMWEAIQTEKQVYFIVLLLLILVASFSIISTLVMVVMEKSRDIAILKTMGASDGMVLRIFILQGAVIGVSGILLGTVLGFAGCVALREYGWPIPESIFSMKTVPVHMHADSFLVVALAAFVITLSAGIYPAVRASRLRPADALRFE